MKKYRRNPAIARQGGPRITKAVRFTPHDLATVLAGADAGEESLTETITLGAVSRAKTNIARAAAKEPT